MGTWIDEHDIPALVHGARYLGCGGGGDSRLMQLLTIQALRTHGPVSLLSSFECEDEEWVAPVALIGSNLIFNEKLLGGHELTAAIRGLEREKGIFIRAVMGLEVGGVNVLTPVLTAALTGLPLIDCDGMGRAFDKICKTTFHAFGVPLAPLLLVNGQGEGHILRHPSNLELERQASQRVVEMGGWAAVACYPMQGKQIKEVAIHQSFSLAKLIGEQVLAVGEDISAIEAVLSDVFGNSIYGKPRKLIEGKVTELQRHFNGESTTGTMIVEGTGLYTGEQLEVAFHHEYLAVKQDNQILTSIPDLICVWNVDTGQPILVEELEQNRKIWVLTIPSPSLLKNPKVLDVVVPEGLRK
ncbi:DUF917 domain-containing protein [Brevibacillus nitrificans]|uniref:DUF917 domain-containing protein n=1 Tax=Brevibacillus nitrificans TaxID=651560 RepID=UPI002605CE21|nr:DUF917 domain-containing protein [Brevibacillus nitrificans]